MTPAIPSASYLAEGLVITSTRSTRFAGSCRSPLLPLKLTSPEGLPSIRIRTLAEPLKLTFPSGSTATEGRFIRMSEALPPAFARSLPTLNIRLSRESSINVFSPCTTTSSRSAVLDWREIAPRPTTFCLALRVNWGDLMASNPINSTKA